MIVPLTPLRFKSRALDYFAHNVAVVCGTNRFTYREYFARADRLSHALLALGIRRGDRVAYLSFNCHYLLEGYYGVVQMGAVLLPLNIRLTADELAFILQDSGTRLLFFDLEFLELAREIQKRTPVEFMIPLEGGAEDAWVHKQDCRALMAAAPAEPFTPITVEENDVAELFYTSGTTDRPKGVMLTHRSLYLHALSVLTSSPHEESDVYVHTIPLFHVNGWGTPQLLTCVGGRHVMLRRFEPEEVFRLIEAERVTRLSAVPTMMTALLNHPALRKYDLSSVRLVLIGGAAAPPAMIREVEEKLGCTCCAGYGLTETSPCLSISFLKGAWQEAPQEERYVRQAMTGYAVPGVELKVMRADGTEVQHDGEEIGEIVARSDAVMAGYWNRPEETARALRDGWFWTGDMATVDADGYLLIVDRAKDIIISGGENIASVEIEKVLQSHPKVLECTVIAAPDERWGEVPMALVVAKEDQSLSEEEVREHCRKHLAGFKIPKRVEFYPSLPKGGTGKILKRQLREKYWEGQAKRVH